MLYRYLADVFSSLIVGGRYCILICTQLNFTQMKLWMSWFLHVFCIPTRIPIHVAGWIAYPIADREPNLWHWRRAGTYLEALGAHDAWPMLSGVWLVFNLTVVFCRQVGETRLQVLRARKKHPSFVKCSCMIMHAREMWLYQPGLVSR